MQNAPESKKFRGGVFLFIHFLVKKDGSGNKAGKGRQAAVHYTGSLLNGQVFDSSQGRSPLRFTTGAGQMIPGFDVMVQDMKLHEKRTIVLPPNMAYGANGIPGVIPGNAYLVFEVELTELR